MMLHSLSISKQRFDGNAKSPINGFPPKSWGQSSNNFGWEWKRKSKGRSDGGNQIDRNQ